MAEQGEPRVAMLPVEEALAAGARAGVSEQMAPLNVFRVLLRHPELTAAIETTLTTLLFAGNRLDVRLRELIILRIGWRTASLYEWTQHWRVARGLDIAEEDLLKVRDWEKAEGLSAADRAVLAATDETLDDGEISDATWKACAAHLDTDAEKIELVVAIANWIFFSQLLKSLRIPLEEGVEPWPPDGVEPS